MTVTKIGRFLLFLLISITSLELKAQNQDEFRVFLIGDAGAPRVDTSDLILKSMKEKMSKAGANSAVIFLGDNIYPNGMPPEKEKGRERAEARFKAQLDILKDYKGKSFIIPGNHDWKEGRKKGLEYLKEEEKVVQSYLNNADIFQPKGGCPGPVEVSLSDNITLVLIDTQWWLHQWDKPGEDSDCDVKDAESLLIALEDIIYRNKSKKVIVAGHHPLFTNGPHGGYYPLKYHIFPLTELDSQLYIPFPVIGSIYPFYRGVLGSVQDLPHPKYRLLKKNLLKIFNNHPGLIYAAGHDHSLQYTLSDSVNYIVSGAGSKITYVRKRDSPDEFTALKKGFAEIIFKANASDSLLFYTVDNNTGREEIIFKRDLVQNPGDKDSSNNLSENTFPDSITIKASDKYFAGKFKKFLMGNNYRNEWQTAITVPVFRLHEEKGGLKILQKGGGMQTKSLRLEDSHGKEYVLRSIEKYPENAIPPALKGSIAQDIVQDQISAAHPYAALGVTRLAEALGIPHTHPKVVYIPDDPGLGIYQRAFANTLALFEERNPETHSDKEGKVKSTTKVIENLAEDNDNSVDQQAVLKARLFDLLLGDWDRHDDQWRWDEESHKKRKVYRPLPRDRDQTFFVNEGVLPKIASKKWALPKIQGFDNEIPYVEGFMFNARYFDRSFLTALSKEDWQQAAENLKNSISDSLIEASVRNLPKEMPAGSSSIIISKLKNRRNSLTKYALKYYTFLAEAVDITGSDKQELFKVIRNNDRTSTVTVIKINKKGELEDTLYHRIFSPSETKEIRLYGLGGKDRFEFEGKSDRAIKVRVVGGEDTDELIDQSEISAAGKSIYLYDTKEGNEFTMSKEIRNLTSEKKDVNEYNRKSFKYNLLSPLLSAEFNIDDGIFIGGGFLYRKQGFRKEPYAQQHKVTGNVAMNTLSFNFRYTGQFTKVVRNWDLLLDLDLNVPNYVNNFFGLGNESKHDDDRSIRYYRVRFEQGSFGAYLVNNLGHGQTFMFGPNYSRIEVEENPERFIYNFAENGLDPNNTYNIKDFGGVRLGYNADTRDNKVMPSNGVKFSIEYDYLRNLDHNSFNLSQVQGSFAFYLGFRLPARITLASRFGGGVHFGDYEFYQANYLGGTTNLRGFRKTRFGGKSSFYNNTELRLKLFSFRSYLFPATVGLIGFNDIGRVWESGEESSKWHDGYGGGIWVAPLNQIVVSLTYGFSDEKSFPLVRFGFLF